MQEKIITFATPFFFVLIGIELAWGWHQWRRHGRALAYRSNDAVTSIGLGVMSQICGVFTRLFRIGIYALVFDSLALFTWPADTLSAPHLFWALPLALLMYDLCYYWLHRWGHRIAAFWAAHVVHHSSEDYNLSTALRQTSTGFLLGWIPYLPMAVLGVPPLLFGIVAMIDLLYQFWVHTGYVGRLGWFDRVFVSPSNHRVHHAVNDRYLDRNYGGILIVWDRLFGTFQPELDEEKPVYGTRTPLRSFDPIRANFEVYAALARDSLATRRWIDKLQLWLRPPGWRPADLRAGTPAFDIRRVARYEPPLSAPMRLYVLVQFALVLGLSVHLLQVQRTGPTMQVVAYVGYLVVALVALGGLLEGRRGFVLLEALRLAAGAAMAAGGVWFAMPELAMPLHYLLGALFAGSLLLLWSCSAGLRAGAMSRA